MQFMDLYLLQRANKLKDSLSSGSSTGGSPFTIKSNSEDGDLPNKPHIVPILISGQERYTQGDNANTWSTSWTGAQNDFQGRINDEQSANMAFWGAMGNMQPQNYTNNPMGQLNSIMPRQELGGPRIMYAKGDRVGLTFGYQIPGGSSNYTPFMNAVLFVKNTTNADVSAYVRMRGSNQTSTHSAQGLATISPNNVAKTATTGTSYTNHYTYGSGTMNQDSGNISATFPANKTTAVVYSTSGVYWTAFTSGQQGGQKLAVMGLDTLFNGTNGLVPDLDMTTMAQQSRNNSYHHQQPWRLWKECGDLMGDDT
jgi:hypothetical protein